MQIVHLGIDVAKNKLDCALRLPSGKFKNKVVANDLKGFITLNDWLVKQQAIDVHVCMEATGVYWEAVAEYLANENKVISVVNPSQIKAFGASCLVRTKTDAVDAELIAKFCYERRPEPWQAPSLNEQTLRVLVQRMDALKNMRTQEMNRLEVARDVIKTEVNDHITWLDHQIKLITQKIDDHIDQDPDLKSKRDLLITIPGIGDGTAALLLGFSINPERFDNARQATAFAGLDPRRYESGTSVNGKPRISKIGHSFLRKMLYMPAISTLYKTDWGKLFFERLRRNGKPPKLIIGAMMRKLIHVAFGVLKSGKRFNPALHLT